MAKTQPAKKGVKDFLSLIGNKKSAASVAEKVPETPKFPIPNNPLLAVVSFLECLTYSYDDGRLLVTQSPEKSNCKLQFLLLNPTSNFTEIVKNARSVRYSQNIQDDFLHFCHFLGDCSWWNYETKRRVSRSTF